MGIEKFKWVGAGIGVVSGYLFGAADAMLLALIAFICIDFTTGIIKATAKKNVSSQVMFKGGIKKVGIFCVVAVANVMDHSLALNGVIRGITIGYYMANEGISILENWGSMGLPLPPKLRGVLDQLKDSSPKG